MPIAIGDIHGSYEVLDELPGAFQPEPLVTIRSYSKQAAEALRAANYRGQDTIVCGRHDNAVLTRDGWPQPAVVGRRSESTRSRTACSRPSACRAAASSRARATSAAAKPDDRRRCSLVPVKF